MIVTKRRLEDGRFGARFRVLFDGKDSPFTVEKSTPPKYRLPQLWDVIEGDNDDADVLFDARSLSGALAVIQAIVTAAAR